MAQIDIFEVFSDMMNFPWELLGLTRPSSYISQASALARAASHFATGRGEAAFLSGCPGEFEIRRAVDMHRTPEGEQLWAESDNILRYLAVQYPSNDEAVRLYLKYHKVASPLLEQKVTELLRKGAALPSLWTINWEENPNTAGTKGVLDEDF